MNPKNGMKEQASNHEVLAVLISIVRLALRQLYREMLLLGRPFGRPLCGYSASLPRCLYSSPSQIWTAFSSSKSKQGERCGRSNGVSRRHGLPTAPPDGWHSDSPRRFRCRFHRPAGKSPRPDGRCRRWNGGAPRGVRYLASLAQRAVSLRGWFFGLTFSSSNAST